MSPRPVPDNPVLVVSPDPGLQRRIDTLLHQLPLDAPGLPSPATPVTADTPESAATAICRAQRSGGGFSLAITDSVAAAQAIWSEAPFLSVLHIGLPDAHTLEDAPSHQLLALPASPHPILLQQAVLLLAGRAATEQILRASLEAKQARLEQAEAAGARARDGAIAALSALLEAVDPDLADRADRVASLAARTAEVLELSDPTALLLAARMSMLGMAGLPEATRTAIRTGKALEEREERARRLQTRAGHRILSEVEGVEAAAELLSLQTPDRSGSLQRLHPRRQVEATVLRLALEIDARVCAGLVPVTAAEDIAASPPPGLRAAVRDQRLMGALHDACLQERDVRVDALRVSQLRPGMILYEDVHTARGALLVRKNQELHQSLIGRLKRFAAGVGVEEPVSVLVPMGRRRVKQQRAG